LTAAIAVAAPSPVPSIALDSTDVAAKSMCAVAMRDGDAAGVVDRINGCTSMTRVTLGKSRMWESRTSGSVRAKAEWLSYSTVAAADQADMAWTTEPPVARLIWPGDDQCHGTTKQHGQGQPGMAQRSAAALCADDEAGRGGERGCLSGPRCSASTDQ